MSTTLNQIKNHPGFMPFGCAGTSTTAENTQSEKERQTSEAEKASDASKSK